MCIAYGSAQDMRVDRERQEIQIMMGMDADGVIGRIPLTLLRSVAAGEPDVLAVARHRFDRITDYLGLRLFVGDRQPDGSVILRQSDLTA